MASLSSPDDRAAAFGQQLIEVHQWLRDQLDELRAGVESYLDGSGEPPRELRMHCLALCSAVTRHHTGEDAVAFPALAEQVPELAPVIAQLRQDHEQVTMIMSAMRATLGKLRPGLDPAQARLVRAELDGLAAVLESHFGYEERKIVAALDALRAPGWTSPPDFLLTEHSDDHAQ